MFAKVYRLERAQIVPISLDMCWAFFSNPRNLSVITPPWLDFSMLPETPTEVYAGLVLRYDVRPLLGIRLRWVSEITHLREPHFFVDEQRFGPYRFWHHQHIFREVDDGVEVRDIVHYSVGLGPLGRVLHALAVRRKLGEIFDYRTKVLNELFAAPAALAQ